MAGIEENLVGTIGKNIAEQVELFSFTFPDMDRELVLQDVGAFDGVDSLGQGSVTITMNFEDPKVVKEFMDVPLPLAQRCWRFFDLVEDDGELYLECRNKWIKRRIIESGLI